jgi:hypothetical protein
VIQMNEGTAKHLSLQILVSPWEVKYFPVCRLPRQEEVLRIVSDQPSRHLLIPTLPSLGSDFSGMSIIDNPFLPHGSSGRVCQNHAVVPFEALNVADSGQHEAKASDAFAQGSGMRLRHLALCDQPLTNQV